MIKINNIENQSTENFDIKNISENNILKLIEKEKEHAEKLMQNFFNAIVVIFLLSIIFLLIVIMVRWWS
jgi:lipopolysaccharide/colanic/teichoic acid biosynthesis glycosyltransferase